MAARHFGNTVLTSFVDGRLPPGKTRGVIAHLLRCPRCVDRLKPLLAATWRSLNLKPGGGGNT